MAKKKTHICCLCGKEFTEWPNNPRPLSNTGVCCRECNRAKVIPARLRIAFEAHVNKEGKPVSTMYGKESSEC